MHRNLRKTALLFLLFLTSCSSEYFDHHAHETTELFFSASSGAFRDTDFFTLPDIGALDRINADIKNAKNRIWLEVYTWTEKSTITSILEAHKRGVDVRVILEGNVYQTPRINDPYFDILKEANIPVYFADNARYNFTHAKFWLIDDRFCIATGNWSYSTFTKNRDFIFCARDESVLSDLEEVFSADSKREKPLFADGLDSRLGLSPLNMRSYIESAIEKSQKNLYIYNQTLSDDDLISLLEEKYKQGVDVRVCVGTDVASGTLDRITFPLHRLEKPYLHAKLMLIDDSELLVGSMNFTTNALDNNREVAIRIGENEKYYSQAKKLFFHECFPD